MTFEQMMLDFRCITGLPEAEIRAAISALPIFHEDAFRFYLTLGRFPVQMEAEKIRHFGLSPVLTMLQHEKTLDFGAQLLQLRNLVLTRR